MPSLWGVHLLLLLFFILAFNNVSLTLCACVHVCLRTPAYAFKGCMFDLYVSTCVDGGLLGRGSLGLC